MPRTVALPIGTDEYSEAAVDIATSGDQTVVAAVAGQTIRIYSLFVVAASSVAVIPKDGASTNLTGAMTLGSWTLDENKSRAPWFTLTRGNAFILNLGGNVQVSGRVYYIQG